MGTWIDALTIAALFAFVWAVGAVAAGISVLVYTATVNICN
jgi:hypothetical protein